MPAVPLLFLLHLLFPIEYGALSSFCYFNSSFFSPSPSHLISSVFLEHLSHSLFLSIPLLTSHCYLNICCHLCRPRQPSMLPPRELCSRASTSCKVVSWYWSHPFHHYTATVYTLRVLCTCLTPPWPSDPLSVLSPDSSSYFSIFSDLFLPTPLFPLLSFIALYPFSFSTTHSNYSIFLSCAQSQRRKQQSSSRIVWVPSVTLTE